MRAKYPLPRLTVASRHVPAFDSPHKASSCFASGPQIKNTSFEAGVFNLWTRGESNSLPPECKTGALAR